MDNPTRDRLIIASFILAAITLLWSLFKRGPLNEALQYIASGDWLAPLAPISVPQLDTGGIVINVPGYAGDPFAGTSVGDMSGQGCGCQPYKCPENRVEYVTLPAPLIAPTVAIAPPVFEYQPAAIEKTCAWNAAGYLSKYPNMQAEWELFSSGKDPAWNKWRKKWPKRGLPIATREQFLYAHYVTWGQQEGWTWNCP